jgi:DNA ligase 1
MHIRPLLAATATTDDLIRLNYPVYVSPKLDGVRAIINGGVAYSRKGIPLPNAQIQYYCQVHVPKDMIFDGEFIVGDKTKDPYRRTVSYCMSVDKVSDCAEFYAFDIINDQSFADRYSTIQKLVDEKDVFSLVPQTLCKDVGSVLAMEDKYLHQGYEGLMIRSVDGKYKHGRSTLKEGTLLKLKRFSDDDAIIESVNELMHNDNEATVDDLGYTKRSHHQDNKVPANTMGSLSVLGTTGPYSGVRFDIGTGFTEEERLDFWNNRGIMIGMTVKYKYFPTGSKDKPRFPSFLGVRE